MNVKQIELLKENIERKFGSAIDNVAALKRLLVNVNRNLDSELSYNTLRRFFGFLPATKPNIKTLNSLSQYLGFKDFHSFSNQSYFPNWETWLYVLRLKQQTEITTEVIPILNRQLQNEYFALYFIDLATHFINQKNKAACLILFEVNLDKMIRSEYLKICLGVGLVLRSFYNKDKDFIGSLLISEQFRRTVVYNFVDYPYFNLGYMELIQQSILIEKDEEHLLFLNLLRRYHLFLNGESRETLALSKPYRLKGVFPIVQGRYYANKLYSSSAEMQSISFEELLIQCKRLNKCQFFFELIPTILLLKRIDWIAVIFSKFQDEIFEINTSNRLTQLSILQIAQVLLFIKEGQHKRAANELKKVNLYLAFDSYIDYITLFYLIAKYHLKEEQAATKAQYLKLSTQFDFKLFSVELLENYFE